ncbi:unnamed protein product [Caenorhabditis bovis]|uniref:Golgin-84 n=1 Tax=Caenorhabditis bovis TaxID=2654633 RepID=A0A8S1F7N7_9PELO|nr:unnamed protein product [Caenorhabditis bovis]
MSWLSKVTDIAGAAENLLNKLDEKTGDAILSAKEAKAKTRKSSTAISIPENVVTEDIGKPAPSIPSRAQSEYAGNSWRYEQSSSNSQPGAYAATASESWTMVLNSKNVNSRRDDDDSRSQKSTGGRSVASFKTTSDAPGNELSSIKSQLWAKESQIAVLKSKLSECEKKLEKRNQEYYEMKAEKEIIEQRSNTQNVANDEWDSLQELKNSRKNAQDQREQAIEESNKLKRKVVALEEEIQAMVEQLRLAKFNLNENKKEFDEYKTKAQKILNAKEKLVESLKAEQGIGSSDRPVHLLQAEFEEMRVERDLAKSDLEAAQMQLYTLRSDMEEMEIQIRDLQSQLSEQKTNHLDEKQTWESSIALLNEKVECARIENEFTKQEMKRQTDLHNTKMAEKENELRKVVEQTRAKIREEQSKFDDDGNAQLADLLLQKQTQLKEALRTNQVLNVRLERLEKASAVKDSTSINMESSSGSSPSHPFLSNVHDPRARNALQTIDSTAFKILSVLRNHPSARLFFIGYILIMHIWLFFIILTYTPEMH